MYLLREHYRKGVYKCVTVCVCGQARETQCLFKAYHFGSWVKLAIYCNWNVRKNVPQHRQQIISVLHSPKTENTWHYDINIYSKKKKKKRLENSFKSNCSAVMASYSFRKKPRAII